MSDLHIQSKQGTVNSSLGIGRLVAAFACGGLKHAPKAILVYLALKHNETRGYCWVSIQDIAHKCSMSPATVKRALRVLSDPDGGRNLITRSLRDERVTKSRKTVILWDRVDERATQFRPPLTLKPSPLSAEDVATIETFSQGSDMTTEKSLRFEFKNNSYDRLDEIVALGKHYFGFHSLFLDPGGEGILRACLHNCIDLAGSGDKCLAVLTWICQLPANEGIRKAVLGSGKLGGYLKASFGDWLSKFDAQSNAPECGEIELTGNDDELDKLFREGCVTIPYREGGSDADFQARDGLINRIREVAGIENVSWNSYEFGFLIRITEHASIAYLLSRHCRVSVHAAQFHNLEYNCNLLKLCVWSIEKDGWATDIAKARHPGEFFIENLDEIRDQWQEENDDQNPDDNGEMEDWDEDGMREDGFDED